MEERPDNHFYATGVATDTGVALGLLTSEKSLNFSMPFKNNIGDLKKRRLNLFFSTIGLKIELAYKFHFAYVVGSEFDFVQAGQRVACKTGIEVTLPLLGISPTLTYIPFRDIGGGILLFSIALGVNGSLSLVRDGGFIRPVA